MRNFNTVLNLELSFICHLLEKQDISHVTYAALINKERLYPTQIIPNIHFIMRFFFTESRNEKTSGIQDIIVHAVMYM